MSKSNPVIVIECQTEAFEFLRDLVRGSLKKAWEDGTMDGQPYRFHLAADDHAEMVLDVFREPKPGGGRHVLRVDDERWHLEHSLLCRMAGLENCPINSMVSMGMSGDAQLWDVGNHDLRLDDTGVLLWGDEL